MANTNRVKKLNKFNGIGRFRGFGFCAVLGERPDSPPFLPVIFVPGPFKAEIPYAYEYSTKRKDLGKFGGVLGPYAKGAKGARSARGLVS